MNPVVASDKLPRTEVWADDDQAVRWAGAFALDDIGHGSDIDSIMKNGVLYPAQELRTETH